MCEVAIPITADDAGTQFVLTVQDSKMERAARLAGPEAFFEFMGHQTEAQRRRYRHLFPHQQRQVIYQVSGN